MNAPRDKSYEQTLFPLLKDPQEAAAYVEAVMDLDDPAALLVALRHVANFHDALAAPHIMKVISR